MLLYVLFSFLVRLWTNKYLERYMVSKLFRVKRNEGGEVDPENKQLSNQSDPIDAGEFGLC